MHFIYLFFKRLVIFSDGEDVDLHLKTNIEGAVIKWAQQVHDLLAEDSYIGRHSNKTQIIHLNHSSLLYFMGFSF